jgi:dTDP-4-dehydrorhamnose reductase
MRIVIAGAKGQLEQDLVRRLSHCHDVYHFGHGELDVTNLDQAIQVIDEA